MSTYLELCQAVARESGTIPTLTDPPTVTGQTGRLLRVVNWTNDAWREIQTERDDWRWMFGMFTGVAQSGTQTYTSTALNVLTRFGGWDGLYDDSSAQWSIFKVSDGQSTERKLTYVPWELFYYQFMTGTYDNGYPQYFTVAPDESVYLHPVPDDTYTVRGFYRKSPQDLTADSDVPEMPARYHDAIKWKALMLLALFDEAFEQIPGFEVQFLKFMNGLTSKQVPVFRTAAALA